MENPIDSFKQLILFIEENIHEVITLEMLEKKSGFSRFQLTRLFLKLTNILLSSISAEGNYQKVFPTFITKEKLSISLWITALSMSNLTSGPFVLYTIFHLLS